MKFYLSVLIEYGPTVPTQMAALDWRRYHGLPEGDSVPHTGNFQNGHGARIEVTEPFARLHFDGKCNGWLSVHADDCQPGDVVLRPYSSSGSAEVLAINPDLSHDRAMQLFHITAVRTTAGTRLAELEKKVEYLNRELRLAEAP